MRLLNTLIPLSAVTLASCAPTYAPIPLAGDRTTMNALAGEWHGEYSSDVTGRSGSIAFTLNAGADTARGDILMVPRGYDQPLAPVQGRAGEMIRVPEILTITFVRVMGDQVSGTLAPYLDPECACPLETTFVGSLTSPGVLEGTYTTRGPNLTAPQSGRWKVTRRKR